jgi:CBS domain-containing protein
VPGILYGTAWKGDRTAALVEAAITLGFRGVDTACQPKHYHEPGVGDGLAVCLAFRKDQKTRRYGAMKTVRDLLQSKEKKEVWSVTPDTLVYRALQLLNEKKIGALVVLEQGELVGIVSERDYARKVILEGKSSKETFTREIMSTKIFVVTPETTVEEGMALMNEKRIRHIPVVAKGTNKILGVISIGDVLKSVISDQKILIEDLSNYIMGKYS